MIEINLLPQDVPGKAAAAATRTSGGGGGGVLVALVMLLALLLVGVSGGVVIMQKQSIDRQLAAVKADEKKLQDEQRELRTKHAQLQEDLLTLRNQAAVLEVLDPKDRLFWAKKLNILPMFVPDGVFITNISMVETVREQETEDSKKAQAAWKKANKKDVPAPPKVMVPVIQSSLRLNGVAYVTDGTSDQRLQLILDFWNALASEKVKVPYNGEQAGFLEQMIPIINSDEIGTETVEGREVSKFSFYMNSIPITAKPVTSPPPARK